VQAAVFRLQLQHLALQGAGLLALVREGGQAVLAEDDAVGHHQRQRTGGGGGGAAAPREDALLGGLGQRGQLQGGLRVVRLLQQLLPFRLETHVVRGADTCDGYSIAQATAEILPCDGGGTIVADTPPKHRGFCYPWQVRMSVLLAISIVALFALVWASIAIAMHVRRARRSGPAGDPGQSSRPNDIAE
jgi:hypothetical protein